MSSSSLREKISLSRATGQVSKTLVSAHHLSTQKTSVSSLVGSCHPAQRNFRTSRLTDISSSPVSSFVKLSSYKNSSSSCIRNGSLVIRNGSGFTLVELMIVIAIIGVLAASLFPMISGYMAKSRDTARMAVVKQMNTAIFSYYQDTGRYPTAGGIGNATRNSTGSISSTGSEWKHDTTKPNNLGTQIAQMMPNMPTDPISTNAYVYGYVYDGGTDGGYYRLYADYERAASEKGLVGYWDMSTLTGSLLRDMSGNGNDGTPMGGVEIGGTGGVVGKATSFNDSTNGISANIPNIPLGSSPRTISVIFQKGIDTVPGLYDFIAGYGHGGAVRNNFFPGYYNQRAFHYGYSADIIGPVLEINKWYHMTITYDGSTLRMYLDGKVVGSNMIIINTINALFYLGGSSGRTLNGLLDEARIYNRALSDSEVADLYKQMK